MVQDPLEVLESRSRFESSRSLGWNLDWLTSGRVATFTLFAGLGNESTKASQSDLFATLEFASDCLEDSINGAVSV